LAVTFEKVTFFKVNTTNVFDMILHYCKIKAVATLFCNALVL